MFLPLFSVSKVKTVWKASPGSHGRMSADNSKAAAQCCGSGAHSASLGACQRSVSEEIMSAVLSYWRSPRGKVYPCSVLVLAPEACGR